MVLAATNECKERAEEIIVRSGCTWTPEGKQWFDEVVVPGFRTAILEQGATWEGALKINALRRLEIMCGLAVMMASGSNMVTREVSDRAFQRLRCHRQEGPGIIIVFCE